MPEANGPRTPREQGRSSIQHKFLVEGLTLATVAGMQVHRDYFEGGRHAGAPEKRFWKKTKATRWKPPAALWKPSNEFGLRSPVVQKKNQPQKMLPLPYVACDSWGCLRVAHASAHALRWQFSIGCCRHDDNHPVVLLYVAPVFLPTTWTVSFVLSPGYSF